MNAEMIREEFNPVECRGGCWVLEDGRLVPVKEMYHHIYALDEFLEDRTFGYDRGYDRGYVRITCAEGEFGVTYRASTVTEAALKKTYKLFKDHAVAGQRVEDEDYFDKMCAEGNERQSVIRGHEECLKHLSAQIVKLRKSRMPEQVAA